ncbi:probable G-protein coupled receptor 141 [Trichomycterus rosablanca]|uniref:probable G-protein coupled receptor 141 n=1 Tax=Trichomycterus rosablanca TaxID=2290929 RepID=UPI002F351E00
MCDNSTNQTSTIFPLDYRISLMVLYTLVFLGGILGVILMCTSLRSNMLSVTSVSVLNLVLVHVLFLLTVPFRVYYYATNSWALGTIFCKMTSSMIHANMYLSIIFYTIILSTRYLSFFEWRHRLEFYRVLHALIASVTIWAVILGLALPATVLTYGNVRTNNNNLCFTYGLALNNVGVKVVNYILSGVVLVIWLSLASCQLYILWQVCRKHGKASLSHQEFWAQIKSLCFLLIMLICFVPYQSFRIYYVSAYCQQLATINEVFIAVTAFSCFDMLIFAGRDMWRPLYTTCCVSFQD